ncbi:MAG: prepilin-type N-terminal cleavage/methylation domain-containing protein [Verrucomicrobia bacterium]|nr:prepilin-type N-terminal cleavage/methylation domain-containing protein [Verrucomicrobiota bacterium]
MKTLKLGAVVPLRLRGGDERDGALAERACRGWTLIEIIAVLAVLAILAAALAPVLIAQLKQAAREQEQSNLEAIARAFEMYVKRTRDIPDQTGWAAAAASSIGWRPEDVSANARGLARVFWIDPQLRVGPEADDVLPYNQDENGSLEPQKPRLLIISSLVRPLPETVVSGVAPSEEAFEEVWNLAPRSVPSSWDWTGQGEDLLVQRIHLAPLFHAVSLNGIGSPRYAVDNSPTNTLSDLPFTAWFLENSVLILCDAEGQCVLKEVVKKDTAYGFDGSGWGVGISAFFGGQPWPTGAELQSIANLFLAAALNPHADNGETPSSLYQKMAAFVAAYTAWAEAGFHSDFGKAVRDARRALEEALWDLIDLE